MDVQEEKQSLPLRVLLSVARVVLVIALFLYVLYHLTNGFSVELETEIAKLYTEQFLMSTNGVIVRNETAVENMTGGVVSYRYENGDRVATGATVCTVYGSGNDAAAVARVAEIDKAIDFLTEAGVDRELSVSDGIAAGQKISEILLDTSDSISRGDYGSVAATRNALLRYSLLRNAALEDDSDSIKAALEALQSERAKLSQSLSGVTNVITAPTAGYFYDYSDGGEKVFDYDRITSLTPEEYRSGLERLEGISSNAAGKIVRVPMWYYVCTVSKAEGADVSEGKKYDLYFSMSDMTLKMKLEAKNVVSDEALLVFSTNEMPEGFDFSRNQKVSVVTGSVSGYRVPSSALRVADGNVGVYIRSGNTIIFRVAEVIHESGSYSYINPETKSVTLFAADENEEKHVFCKGLALYDEVIVKGANELYPEKIIN